jgi:hypothetical protein
MTIFLLIFITGASLNFVVIQENECKMPVLYEGNLNGVKHFGFEFEERGEVDLWYFGDVIKIDRLFFSIGDFFIIGACIGLLIIGREECIY